MYPSANRFPTTFENEIRNSICVFCFPAISENEIQTSIFVFHFPTTLENGIPNSIFVFRRHRQLNFNFHFCYTSFYCFTKLMFQTVLWSFRSTARIHIGTSFLREKAWKMWLYFGVNNINQMEALDNIIDEVFVRNFLQEENK